MSHSETSPVEDEINEYLSRVLEFSRLIDYTTEVYKVDFGTYSNGKGSKRTEAEKKVGPYTFRTTYSPQKRQLENIALTNDGTKEVIVLPSTAVKELTTSYLKRPASMDNFMVYYDIIATKVKDIETLVKKKVSEGISNREERLFVAEDRLKVRETKCEEMEDRFNSEKLLLTKKRFQWYLISLGLGALLTYLGLMYLLHSNPELGLRVFLFS